MRNIHAVLAGALDTLAQGESSSSLQMLLTQSEYTYFDYQSGTLHLTAAGESARSQLAQLLAEVVAGDITEQVKAPQTLEFAWLWWMVTKKGYWLTMCTSMGQGPITHSYYSHEQSYWSYVTVLVKRNYPLLFKMAYEQYGPDQIACGFKLLSHISDLLRQPDQEEHEAWLQILVTHFRSAPLNTETRLQWLQLAAGNGWVPLVYLLLQHFSQNEHELKTSNFPTLLLRCLGSKKVFKALTQVIITELNKQRFTHAQLAKLLAKSILAGEKSLREMLLAQLVNQDVSFNFAPDLLAFAYEQDGIGLVQRLLKFQHIECALEKHSTPDGYTVPALKANNYTQLERTKVTSASLPSSKQKVAVKVFSLPSGQANMKDEIEAYARLNNESRAIVHSKGGFFVDRVQRGLVMSYAEAGSLEDFRLGLGEQPEINMLVKLIADCCEGVAFCHQKWLVHNDIKPNNFVVSVAGDQLKALLCDFDHAQVLTPDMSQYHLKTHGTWSYRAPEKVEYSIRGREGMPVSAEHVFAADNWSLGCLLIFMASQCHPWLAQVSKTQSWNCLLPSFPPQTLVALHKAMQRDGLPEELEAHKKHQPGIMNVARQCMFTDPKKRMSSAWVLQEIKQLQTASAEVKLA